MYGAVARPLRPRMERYAVLEPELDMKAIQPSQAVVALRQIRSYEARAKGQRENGHRLLSALSDVPGLVLPHERPGCEYAYHFFPVLVSDAEERDSVARRMLEKSVDTSRVYFNVVSDARRLGYGGGCPVAEAAAQRMMTLPNYAALTTQEIDYVAETFIEAVEAHRSNRRRKAWAVGAARQESMEVS